jgi:hypothetical protein
MNVLIIGHGPGLKGAKRGAEIDGHESVIRFGDSGYWQTPEDYGTRTDYLLTGDQRIADVINVGTVPRETWVYGRPDFRDEKFIPERLRKFNPVICTETDPWLIRFRELGATGYSTERAPDPHFSQGMAAIIMAADRLRAKEINLMGFQALLAGENAGYESGTNRGAIIRAQHDFATERKLLNEIKEHYGFKLVVG